MSKPHRIAWLNKPGFQGQTLNPITGCTPISPGCLNCYARDLHSKRHKAYLEGKLQSCPQYSTPFEDIRFWPERLELLRKWREPRMVFVGSMCDVFHEDISFEFVAEIIGYVQLAEKHLFTMLTKRPQRMLDFFLKHRHWSGECENCARTVDEEAIRITRGNLIPQKWPLPNLWLGVTVCNQAEADEKIPILLQIPAAKRFVSIEPMLGPIDLRKWLPDWLDFTYSTDPDRLDWVIVGGETGPKARPCGMGWIHNIVQQCKDTAVPVFVKQLGPARQDAEPDYWPCSWGDVRQWPEVG